MYRVWRSIIALGRIAAFLVALPFLLISSNAFAQSSVGLPMNAATGRSLADAVTQNLNELIDQQVLTNPGTSAPAGGRPGGGAAQLGGPRMNANGPGAGGTAAVTGALAAGAMPTGRLRTSEHDGLKPTSEFRFDYKTNEASAFANVVYTAPGTVMGGQLKFSGLAGSNWVSLDLKSNKYAVLDPDQFANADNESFFAGGTVLWASRGTYALASLVGFWGETKLVDSVDDCGPCRINRYEFNTSGFMGTAAAGRVFDLAGASGPKLDLRGSVSYIQNIGDRFATVTHDADGSVIPLAAQKYTFSTWTGTAGVTLFTNMTLQNNALLRPYIQALVRQEWDYRNQIHTIEFGGADLGTFRFQQAHLYGGLSAGLTYNLDKMTLGAAVYTELSGDELSLGGRVGVSWKLN